MLVSSRSERIQTQKPQKRASTLLLWLLFGAEVVCLDFGAHATTWLCCVASRLCQQPTNPIRGGVVIVVIGEHTHTHIEQTTRLCAHGLRISGEVDATSNINASVAGDGTEEWFAHGMWSICRVRVHPQINKHPTHKHTHPHTSPQHAL